MRIFAPSSLDAKCKILLLFIINESKDVATRKAVFVHSFNKYFLNTGNTPGLLLGNYNDFIH